MATETGVAVDDISLETTLFWDMEIMGEGAGTLLQDFAQEFGVGLQALELKNHPEGKVRSTSWGVLFVVAVVPFVLLAWVLGVPGWVFLRLLCLSFLLGNRLESCGRSRNKGPINVQDLVQAAQTQQWLR